MSYQVLERRKFLAMATAAVTAMSIHLYGAEEEAIPFLDAAKFDPAKPRLPWDETTEWITSSDQLFFVGHYGFPPPTEPASWKLDIGGLVGKPMTLDLDALKKRPKKEHTLALECSGNAPVGGLMGNLKFAGTPLAPILKEAGVRPDAVELVFFGKDEGTEKIRGNEYKQNFARALSTKDAMRDDILLGYEMNGQPLNNNHGAPVRLIVPGWYGVAWVKWLTRIEAVDRPYLNRFMARDYVTVRGEQKGDQVVWRETSVGKMNLKSTPARVVRMANGGLRVTGAAWSDGTPLKSVEVKIDSGEWKAAKLTENKNPYTWTFWSYEWTGAEPGEHTVSSRATDIKGKVQPAPDDPYITLKKTYWEANQQAIRKIKI